MKLFLLDPKLFESESEKALPFATRCLTCTSTLTQVQGPDAEAYELSLYNADIMDKQSAMPKLKEINMDCVRNQVEQEEEEDEHVLPDEEFITQAEMTACKLSDDEFQNFKKGITHYKSDGLTVI